MNNLISSILPILTVFGQTALLILALPLLSIKSNLSMQVLVLVKKYGLTFAFIVSATATLGSLFYSEVLGYEPCELCWYQRIFMYPLPFISGLALRKKDRSVMPYIILLASIGLTIALYHYLMQVGLLPSLVCDAVGYSTSCSQRFVMEYGYITIPMMSLTAFGLILTSTILLNKK